MLQKNQVYLDTNAGTALAPEVVQGLRDLLSQPDQCVLLPNASSSHSYGRASRKSVEDARLRVSQSFGLDSIHSGEVVFTSSGTEANQQVIRSVLENSLKQDKNPHWILSSVEHDSVLQLLDWSRSYGISHSLIPVNSSGDLIWDEIPRLIQPNTVLISTMWVNNETGIIYPPQKIRSILESRAILFHSDAAQAWGKLPLNLSTSGVDFATFSAHKVGAPAGLGVVWKNPQAEATLNPLIFGNQEFGFRGGTENALGIHALGLAARAMELEDLDARSKKLEQLRDDFENQVLQCVPGVVINGKECERVSQTSHLSFEGIDGEALIMSLDLMGYSVSSGSACSSGVQQPSHVMMAMGKSESEAKSSIRVSLPWDIQAEVLEGFVKALQKAVHQIRKVG